MCLQASAFIPGRGMNDIVIPQPPDGLVCEIEESMHADLSRIIKGISGISLALHDGHCLCQYDAWVHLFDYINILRKVNDVSEVKLLIYWSDDSYAELSQSVFDSELDTMDIKPEEGVVYRICVDVPRRLESWIGKDVRVFFKNGRQISGVIKTFIPDDGNGMIEDIESLEPLYFGEKEIHDIELLNEGK